MKKYTKTTNSPNDMLPNRIAIKNGFKEVILIWLNASFVILDLLLSVIIIQVRDVSRVTIVNLAEVNDKPKTCWWF